MSGLHLTQFVERAARLFPENEAIRFEGRKSTWASFNQRTRTLAGGLREIGLGEDDRIAILSLNNDRYVELLFASWRISAAVVPFNTRLSTEEMNFLLSDCEPKAVIVDDTFAAMLPSLELPPCLEKTIFIGRGEPPQGSVTFDDLVTSDKPLADLGRGGSAMAGIFYTGGTTGRPKGVMLSHEGLILTLMASGAQAKSADRPAASSPPLQCVLPMFHLAGAQLAIAAAINAAPFVMLSGFDPAEIIACIERDRIEMLSLVPAMWGMLLSHPAAEHADLSSLKIAAYGASPMPEGTLRKCIARLPGAEFSQGYGQTELSGIYTLLGPEDHDVDAQTSHRLRSAGLPIAFAELRIVGQDGNELPRNETGEIAVRSSGAMLIYWKRPEETAQTIRDGWIMTGDAGYIDDDGYLFIVDRTKDMIISGGENVYSAEVESVLSQHPAVLECAVIGVPDEQWGERVHAVVRVLPDQETDGDTLIAFCKNRIAGYKCPRTIDFRDEPLPISAAGKILKRDLRTLYWKGQDRSVN